MMSANAGPGIVPLVKFNPDGIALFAKGKMDLEDKDASLPLPIASRALF
jgi:hypothetical protein